MRIKYLIDFLKTKSTMTPDLSLFHEVQDITREHFNHSINRANQFFIADMQIMKAENHGKPQDRSYKHRIFTNPVKILRFLNRTIWCDCYLMRTCMISLMISNLRQIGQLTVDLAALEHLKSPMSFLMALR